MTATLLAACAGEPAPTGPTADAGISDAGGQADAGFADAGPVDPVVYVPAALPTLSASTGCLDLAAGERVLGHSPGGHLWLGATSSGATSLRVLDPWALDTPQNLELEGAIARVHAKSATVADYVDEGQLFRLAGGLRTAIRTPMSLVPEASLCGEATDRALVLNGGALYAREGDAWFQYEGAGAALAADARLLDRDGACAGGEDAVWFATGALELWTLGQDTLTRPGHLEGATQASLLPGHALALRDGRLFVGPEAWTEYAFDLGAANLLDAAGDAAWLVVDGHLLRFDGEDFEAVGTSTDARALHATAAGGVWVEETGRVCHVGPSGTLRVEGTANGRVSEDDRLLVRVLVADGETLAATLDGDTISGRATSAGIVFDASLTLGWHALTLTAGDVQRTLHVKRLPSVERSFATDVQPIFQTHCSMCHVPDNAYGAPDLSTVDAWRARAGRLRDRVVRVGDMPPSSVRSPDWGDDQVTVIDEWLSGGMNP